MKNKVFYKIIICLLIGLSFIGVPAEASADSAALNQQQAVLIKTSNWILKQAFRNKKSGLQVMGRGIVQRLLSDDVNGDRHQRFILRLSNNQTLLIAHNIDIAPRLVRLKLAIPLHFMVNMNGTVKAGLFIGLIMTRMAAMSMDG